MREIGDDVISTNIKLRCSKNRHQTVPSGKEDQHLIDIPTPPEVGTGQAGVLRIDTGTFVCKHSHHFQPRYREGFYQPFHSMEESASEIMFQVKSTGHGETHSRDLVTGKNHIIAPGTDLFGCFEDINETILIGPGKQFENSKLVMPVSQLSNFLGEKVTRALITALGIDGKHAFRNISIPARISATLQQACSSFFCGELGNLFAQGKVLQYLAQLADHITGDVVESDKWHEERKVRQLREELENSEGAPPSLANLAQRYGTSVKTLNNSFKHVHGCTIGAFLRDRKLEYAHTALLETDIAMKILSAHLGYSHVNHFNAAFRRKFGYSPGTLRR